MMYWNNHMTSGGWVISILAIVILLVLGVAGLVWVRRQLRGSGDPGPSGPSSALEVLDRRLASGEIKTEQYVDLRRTLLSRTESTPIPK